MDQNLINTILQLTLPPLVGGVVVAVNNFLTKKNKMDSIQSSIATAITKIDSVSSQVQGMDIELSYIKGKLNLDGSLVRSHSPLSLTQSGQVLLEASKGDKFLETHKDRLIEEIKLKKPTSLYDIQEFARIVLSIEAKYESFKDIKNYAYLQGKMIEDIILVMSIKLRDIALKEIKL
jgi:hypothetical protein